MNRRPTEASAATAMMTIGSDGGMIGPMTELAAVMAQEKSSSKPLSRMAWISTLPSPPASATAVPDMPANSTEATTLACPRPPGRWPTKTLAKLNIRFVTPEEFIRFPMMMKKGAAINVKELAAMAMRWMAVMALKP